VRAANKICSIARNREHIEMKTVLHRERWTDPGLSWSQLRAFQTCARLSSFNAAATELNLTASAVRHQVGLLEARLGVFERQTSRPMRDLVSVCATASRMAAAVPIILTAPPLFARQFLFDDRFLKWCDRNQVELDISDLKRDLFGTNQIVAVRLGPEPDPDLVSTPVFDVQLVLAAAPTIAARARPTDQSWWLEQTLLSPGVSDIAWPHVWRALKVSAPETTRPLHFSSYAAALEAACAGHGVLLAPLPFSELEFASGRLSRFSNICLPSRIRYSLLMRRELAGTSRGRALRRRIVAEIKPAKRS
jgi:LysR family transcriptional regulator, glycine cleavage system transcriptional activator